MQKQSLPRNLWCSLTPIFAYSLCQLVMIIFGVSIVFIYNLIYEISNKSSIWQMYIGGTIFSITPMLADIMYYVNVRQDWKNYEAHQPRYVHKARTLNLGICVFFTYIGLNILIWSFLYLSGLTDKLASDKYSFNSMLYGNPILYFVASVLVGPIMEELCLRGFVFNRLMSWLKPGIALFIQAIIFGVLHLDPLHILAASIAGLALGLLYLRYKKLWPCIIGHMAFNLVGFSHEFAQIMQIKITPVPVLVIGMALTVIGGFFLLKQPASVPLFDSSKRVFTHINYQPLSVSSGK
ncbi:MAG: CPBP family intramembrane metalloprotease [Oscillospiraceae bacterium]|nr:CPBP family intramembrane metalloprotease [Oscillospiraceae bacterium]